MKNYFSKIFKSQVFIHALGVAIICTSIGGFALANDIDRDLNLPEDVKKLVNIQGDVSGDINFILNPNDQSGLESTSEMVGGGSLHNYANTIFVNGLRAGRLRVQAINSSGEIAGIINSTTGSFSGTLAVLGETSVEGLTDGAGANQLATSTGTTNLTEAQLLADSYIEVMVNTGTTATLNLVASSSWTTLLPNISDHRSWLINNATSSTMALTITVGAGIDLVGVTTDDDVIDETEFSKVDCWRKPNTDIVCSMTEWLHLD